MSAEPIMLTIGRAPTCDIRVDDEYASPIHARLTIHPGGRVTVQDAGSTNGARVRGVTAWAPTPVVPSDTVLVGRTPLLVADLLQAAARMHGGRA